MGAAAFVMADLTGIPYSTIIIAAIVPGILYYLSLGVSVYLEADKQGLQAESADKLPQVKKVLKEGWYYALPIIVLIVALLGFGLSANFAALFSIAVLLVIGFAKEWLTNKRLPFKEVFNALVKASKTTVSVTVACACAGIVIGIVSMTGIGIKFTSIVFKLSGGHLVLMLLLVMLACIIMGMGLPSTAAYIIRYCGCTQPDRCRHPGVGREPLRVLFRHHVLHHPASGGGRLCGGRPCRLQHQ